MFNDNDKKVLLSLDDIQFNNLVSDMESLLHKADQLLSSHVELDYNTMHQAASCNPDEMETVEREWSKEVLNALQRTLGVQRISITIDLLYPEVPSSYSEYGKKGMCS